MREGHVELPPGYRSATRVEVLFDGDVEVIVDWTYPDSAIEVTVWNVTVSDGVGTRSGAVASGNGLVAGKPLRLSFRCQFSGTYDLEILNLGPRPEAVAYQVLDTPTRHTF